MSANSPKVTVGLPVYNGEKFVGEAIESVLAQTFADFELIISDNASTDRTAEICREYAERDERIRYHRNDVNVGLARNYSGIVPMARGDYFRWHAADDLVAPTFLERCVEVLDNCPECLVAHTKVEVVSEDGSHQRYHEDLLDFRDDSPARRLRQYLFRPAGMWAALYALYRTDIFRQTHLLGGYLGADKVLLGELVLWGKMCQVPEYLMVRRWHKGQSWQKHRTPRKFAANWDPRNADKWWIWPEKLTHFHKYLSVIAASPIPMAEKLKCYGVLTEWGARRILWRSVFPARRTSRPQHT